jgi:hypothetical protein
MAGVKLIPPHSSLITHHSSLHTHRSAIGTGGAKLGLGRDGGPGGVPPKRALDPYEQFRKRSGSNYQSMVETSMAARYSPS